MRYTFKFENKLQAVRVAIAIEDACEASFGEPPELVDAIAEVLDAITMLLAG